MPQDFRMVTPNASALLQEAHSSGQVAWAYHSQKVACEELGCLLREAERRCDQGYLPHVTFMWVVTAVCVSVLKGVCTHNPHSFLSLQQSILPLTAQKVQLCLGGNYCLVIYLEECVSNTGQSLCSLSLTCRLSLTWLVAYVLNCELSLQPKVY